MQVYDGRCSGFVQMKSLLNIRGHVVFLYDVGRSEGNQGF